jgi:hypothetical protein
MVVVLLPVEVEVEGGGGVMVVVVVAVFLISFTFNLFSVEVSMAMTGRAVECLNGTLFTTWHELTTTICGIPSHCSCMVFKTFSVPHHH